MIKISIIYKTLYYLYIKDVKKIGNKLIFKIVIIWKMSVCIFVLAYILLDAKDKSWLWYTKILKLVVEIKNYTWQINVHIKILHVGI